MLASLHIADVGASRAFAIMRSPPRPEDTPGLQHADPLTLAGLGATVLPRPQPGSVALFAVWCEDAALDDFLAAKPLGGALDTARSLRLQPLRASGSWRGMPLLVDGSEREAAGDEPVAVLTLGRLKLHRIASFLRASARAEADALTDPAVLFATGLARPPRIVSTFTLWSSADAMRAFAYRGAGHVHALEATARRDFHHESTFLRFRPYAAMGDWGAAALALLAQRSPASGAAA